MKDVKIFISKVFLAIQHGIIFVEIPEKICHFVLENQIIENCIVMLVVQSVHLRNKGVNIKDKKVVVWLIVVTNMVY